MTAIFDETSSKLAARSTLELYLNSVDRKDWAGVASCFTTDAVARFNNEPNALSGGEAVGAFAKERMSHYGSTIHALGNLSLTVSENVVTAISHVTASLELRETIRVRALRYTDSLILDSDGTWRIFERLHMPLWQYEVAAVQTYLM